MQNTTSGYQQPRAYGNTYARPDQTAKRVSSESVSNTSAEPSKKRSLTRERQLKERALHHYRRYQKYRMSHGVRVDDYGLFGDSTNPQAIAQNSWFGQFSQGVPAVVAAVVMPRIMSIFEKHPKLLRLGQACIVIWLVFKYAADKLFATYKWLMSWACSSVKIVSGDTTLYKDVKEYIRNIPNFRTRKEQTASSATHIRNCLLEQTVEEGKSVGYDGAADVQYFRHQGRWFMYTIETSAVKIWTWGLSPRPIQQFLEEIHISARDKEQISHIPVFRAAVDIHGTANWNVQSSVLGRSLDSVCLDSDTKKKLVDDLEDYLDKNSAGWYARQGIPHRRGYLLHGKPGCGKTSFAMAAASHFGLSIYSLSLLDNNMTDESLLSLFSRVQKGCLVLLEDIDSAGIGRQLQEENDKSNNGNPRERLGRGLAANAREHFGPGTLATTAINSAKNETTHDFGDNPSSYLDEIDNLNGLGLNLRPRKRKAQVTLSGLLNAIDGVSAPVGHVLIMTTNHPELLDEALIRPGRIDHKAEFLYASCQQVRDIFIKIYTPARTDVAPPFDLEKIPALAENFSRQVPERLFSPASIQQFLLTKKTTPIEAEREIASWVAIETEKMAAEATRKCTESPRSEESFDSGYVGDNSGIKTAGFAR